MNEHVEHLCEMLELFGAVTARRMFGGHGLYHQGLMFALVSDGTLYLKADDETRPTFERLGLARFEYERQGRRVRLSYYCAPEIIADDRDEAAKWARLAFDAAVRAAK